jgi:hypothetical protein
MKIANNSLREERLAALASRHILQEKRKFWALDRMIDDLIENVLCEQNFIIDTH